MDHETTPEHPADENTAPENAAPENTVLEHGDRETDVRRRTATVRGIELGRARPEILVPLVGSDLDELLAQAQKAVATRARIMEWRLDCFRPDLEDALDHREAVLAAGGESASDGGEG